MSDSCTYQSSSFLKAKHPSRNTHEKFFPAFPRAADGIEDSAGEGSPALSGVSPADGALVRSLLRRRLGGRHAGLVLPSRFQSGRRREQSAHRVHAPRAFFSAGTTSADARIWKRAARSLLGSRTALRYEWPQGSPAAHSPLAGPASTSSPALRRLRRLSRQRPATATPCASFAPPCGRLPAPCSCAALPARAKVTWPAPPSNF